MIPEFDPNTGFLPVGMHTATWQEFVAKYGYTPHRMKLINGLYRAVQDLKSCGCSIIYPDGSFITEKERPRDIDVCWDKTGVDMAALKLKHNTFFDHTKKKHFTKYGCEFFDVTVINGVECHTLKFFQKYYGVTSKGILKINI